MADLFETILNGLFNVLSRAANYSEKQHDRVVKNYTKEYKNTSRTASHYSDKELIDAYKNTDSTARKKAYADEYKARHDKKE